MRYARWMRGRCIAAVQRPSVLGAIEETLEQLRRMLRDIGPEGVVGQPVAVDQRDQPILAQLHHMMLGRGFRQPQLLSKLREVHLALGEQTQDAQARLIAQREEELEHLRRWRAGVAALGVGFEHLRLDRGTEGEDALPIVIEDGRTAEVAWREDDAPQD